MYGAQCLSCFISAVPEGRAEIAQALRREASPQGHRAFRGRASIQTRVLLQNPCYYFFNGNNFFAFFPTFCFVLNNKSNASHSSNF